MKNCLIKAPSYLSLLFLLVVCNSCKKTKEQEIIYETGTVTDVENHVYKTIKIGNQWWMAEDLKATKYRNGNPINRIALETQSSDDSISWINDTAGAYCDNYDNGQHIIGKLYNAYVISDINKIAPAGWHIPTDDEWKTLETQLGISPSEADKAGWRGSSEGDKMKVKAPESWTIFGEVWGNNESGFSAMAYGCRLFNSEIGYPGLNFTSFWWSSTAKSGNETYYRYLDYKNSNIFRSHCVNNYGFSIRCVKD